MSTVKVEVLLPAALLDGRRTFTLDVSLLDGPDPLESVSLVGSFIIGTSLLDGDDVLGGMSPPRSWVDITGPLTEIAIDRGCKREGPRVTTNAGTATVHAYNALKGLQIPAGTPLRVALGQTLLFTGTTSRPGVEYVKDPGHDEMWAYRYTLEAVDCFRDLSILDAPTPLAGYSVNNFFVPHRPQDEDFWGWGIAQSRFAAILDPVGMPWRKTASEGPMHHHDYTNLVERRSITDSLDLACNTIGALWWIDTEGTVTIHEPDPAAGPELILSALDLDRSFTDIDAAQDPDDIITGLDIDFVGAPYDAATNPAAKETSQRIAYDDPTATATWGPHRQTLTLAAGGLSLNPAGQIDPSNGPEQIRSHIARWADQFITRWRPEPLTITQVSVPGLPGLDIGSVIGLTGLQRANTAPNPSFEAGVSGWGGIRCTITSDGSSAKLGARSCLCTVTDASANSALISSTAANGLLPVNGATTITVSYWLRDPAAGYTQLAWRNGVGAITYAPAVYHGAATDQWRRVGGSFTPPADAVSFSLTLAAATRPVGSTFRVDAVLVEPDTDQIGSYVEGGTSLHLVDVIALRHDIRPQHQSTTLTVKGRN